MTPPQIMDAYKATLRLSNTVFPYKVARNVARLKRRLEEEAEIISDTEKAIIEKYGGTVDKNGHASVGDPEKANECAEELNDFRKQEDDIKFQVIDLSKYINTIRISPSDIEALEGIVIFEKGEVEDG